MHRPGEEGDQIPNRDMSEAQEGKPSCRGQKIPLRERLRIGGQWGARNNSGHVRGTMAEVPEARSGLKHSEASIRETHLR